MTCGDPAWVYEGQKHRMLLPWIERWQGFTNYPAYCETGPKDHERDYPAPKHTSDFSAQMNRLVRPSSSDLIAYSTRFRSDSVYSLKAKHALVSQASKFAVKSVIYRVDQELRPNRTRVDPGSAPRLSMLQAAQKGLPSPFHAQASAMPARLPPVDRTPSSPFRARRSRTIQAPTRRRDDLRNTLTRDSYHEFTPGETTRWLDRCSRAAADDRPLGGPF
ncbi:hypothetical protein SARC_04209 [Sphaeroforma arctica JP610]|uniref:Uncharacterized protein n=1 Tax=Sphaeroforma arctica JP610 TaxID=667725 RepID=A0A0L0G3X6_9EUKA|nr:hypothetical protein SARC_04209 [Sphaeroforma arctica JP610]KNC83536.1 hypothetical protein SARC_04209 [Sphaeroforma arctica JP610]|eukprot:XP_014157438.1 hypothetical protein SARC_04209 [Sphaeroforma arctica JP610]